MKKDFRGVGVALATPFNEDYSIDYNGLKKLVTHCENGNVDYLVVQGTTGESPTISWEDQLKILQYVIDNNAKKLPIVFGLGGNNTLAIIEKLKTIAEYQVDAILSVAPYYNRPSQAGMQRHFEMIADNSPKPIVLYNVPSRTASNIAASTTLNLSKHPNIIAIKEASGDLEQIQEILNNKPEDFDVLSGDDALTNHMIELGGNGVISVIGNLFPKQFCEMVHASLEGKAEVAKKLDSLLQPSYQLLAEEGNPTSLKTALDIIGVCGNTVRPPLIEGSDTLKNKWKSITKDFV